MKAKTETRRVCVYVTTLRTRREGTRVLTETHLNTRIATYLTYTKWHKVVECQQSACAKRGAKYTIFQVIIY